MIGETILNYKILEKLGEGGMGVVYKAEDMKLNRFVALKFLPKGIEADETEKARFLQEARAASALNHPNVCIIYDIAEEDDQQFIVMEFVDGVTIRQKIREKEEGEHMGSPLQLKDIIEWAIQIGSALQAAHSKDITHRDIKSDNIMINISNQVKVMDFGLAKLKGALKLTKTSSTVGTLAYMSPEQIQGKETDARMDIFSFGVVFYEMLTGRLPFQAEYESALMYSILNTEPEPVIKHRPELSSGFIHLLDRALEKEPEDRYQTVNDMVIELRRLKRDTSRVSRKVIAEMPPAETAERPAEVVVSPQKKIGRAIGRLPLYISAAALVILLAVVSYLLWWGKRPPAVLEFTNTTQVTTAVGVEDYPTWSPDGRTIAYQSDQSGNNDIWVKQAGGGPAVNLTEEYTGSDGYPSWSPDGNQIAFWSNRDGGGLFIMPALGGKARKVAASQDYWSLLYLGPRPGPPQWSADGTELAYSVGDTAGCFVEIVSLKRATSRRLRLPGPEDDPIGWELNWSHDGRYFAYATTWNRNSPTSQVWVLRAEDGVGFLVEHGGTRDWSPSWSRDGNTLYFVSDREGSFDLYQQRIRDDGAPMGSPQQLTTGLEMRYAKFSPDGKKLAYSKGQQVGNLWRVPLLDDRQATWTDAQQLTFGQAILANVNLSQDGKWFAFSRVWEGERQVWVMPVEGGEPQRLMMDPMSQLWPIWSPDGREIVFYSEDPGNRNIWVVPLDGSPAHQLTLHEAMDAGPMWSPDGREIAFGSGRSGNWDIWIVPSEGGTARQLTRHAADEGFFAWSPAGKEIAFGSNRSGNLDIWTIPARGGEARQVTDNPANDQRPRWSPDGQWIVFRSNRTGSNSLWRVPAEGGSPEPVTEGNAGGGVWSKDGKKVYFRRGGNIREVPFMGGAERQLTDLAGKYGSLSSISAVDEQYIYFLWNENTGDIWVMNVEGNE